jgi:uncharacterized membrane protein
MLGESWTKERLVPDSDFESRQNSYTKNPIVKTSYFSAAASEAASESRFSHGFSGSTSGGIGGDIGGGFSGMHQQVQP